MDINKKGGGSGSVAGGGGQGSGKEKFREMLSGLRRNEGAPGAKGI